jgi:hypothetical protein
LALNDLILAYVMVVLSILWHVRVMCSCRHVWWHCEFFWTLPLAIMIEPE